MIRIRKGSECIATRRWLGCLEVSLLGLSLDSIGYISGTIEESDIGMNIMQKVWLDRLARSKIVHFKATQRVYKAL